MSGALAGWRVAGGRPTAWRATFCAKVLADLGAEVVKVEPPEGHSSRAWGPRRPDARPGEAGGRFQYLNTSKQSVVIGPGAGDDARGC